MQQQRATDVIDLSFLFSKGENSFSQAADRALPASMWRFLGLEGASQDGTGRMVSLGGRQLRLQRVMAEGGHATIYEARDTGSGARLAVKRVLVPEERAAAAARELEIHRSLRHDNLLALLGDSHERRERATQRSFRAPRGGASEAGRRAGCRRKDGTEEFLALLPFAGGGHLWECVASAPKGGGWRV